MQRLRQRQMQLNGDRTCSRISRYQRKEVQQGDAGGVFVWGICNATANRANFPRPTINQIGRLGCEPLSGFRQFQIWNDFPPSLRRSSHGARANKAKKPPKDPSSCGHTRAVSLGFCVQTVWSLVLFHSTFGPGP